MKKEAWIILIVVAVIAGIYIYSLHNRLEIIETEFQRQKGQSAPNGMPDGKVIVVTASEVAGDSTASSIQEVPVLVVSKEMLPEPVKVAPKVDKPIFSHSEDFRVVCVRGEKYELTGTQARVIERLWAAVKAGCPEVHQSKLLEDLGIYSKRIRDVFKADMDAFKVLIGRGKRKGVFYLNIA